MRSDMPAGRAVKDVHWSVKGSIAELKEGSDRQAAVGGDGGEPFAMAAGPPGGRTASARSARTRRGRSSELSQVPRRQEVEELVDRDLESVTSTIQDPMVACPHSHPPSSKHIISIAVLIELMVMLS